MKTGKINGVEVVFDGAQGDYNVRTGELHIGRVKLEPRKYTVRGAPRWYAYTPWNWQGGPASHTGETCGAPARTRNKAAENLIQRARNAGKITTEEAPS